MAAVATAPAGTPSRWIVNRGVDLTLVIGSVFAGYVYLLLYTALHVKISLLWWFWCVGFDGTHIFATASRTYFDREARARDRKLLYGSLLVFFSLGPLMVLAGQKGLPGAAGGRLGLLSRDPPALRLPGALQGEEPRPAAAR